MGSKLMQDLGAEYVDSMWRGALFTYKDYVCTYMGTPSESEILVRVCKLDGTSSRSSNIAIPSDALESMASFAWPKLGYRNVPSPNYGNLVAFVTSRRSAMRGLREDLIDFDPIPVLSLDNRTRSVKDVCNSRVYLPQIFNPTFYGLQEASRMLLDNEAGGVALSEDLAIGVSCMVGPERHYDVYFKQRIIGSMDESGIIEIANKKIKGASVAKLLQKGQYV